MSEAGYPNADPSVVQSVSIEAAHGIEFLSSFWFADALALNVRHQRTLSIQLFRLERRRRALCQPRPRAETAHGPTVTAGGAALSSTIRTGTNVCSPPSPRFRAW